MPFDCTYKGFVFLGADGSFLTTCNCGAGSAGGGEAHGVGLIPLLAPAPAPAQISHGLAAVH